MIFPSELNWNKSSTVVQRLANASYDFSCPFSHEATMCGKLKMSYRVCMFLPCLHGFCGFYSLPHSSETCMIGPLVMKYVEVSVSVLSDLSHLALRWTSDLSKLSPEMNEWIKISLDQAVCNENICKTWYFLQCRAYLHTVHISICFVKLNFSS